MPDSGWAEQTDSGLQFCGQSKGLTETMGGLETQPVLTGLVRRPQADRGFLLGSILLYEEGSYWL